MNIDELKKVLKPGYVISQFDKPDWWNIPMWFVWLGITSYQRSYFGRKADVSSTHTMLYLDDDHILQAVLPVITWIKLSDLEGKRIKVFKPTFYTFTKEDCDLMIAEFENEREYLDDNDKPYKAKIIGSHYNVGQLFDIMINGMLAYPNEDKVHIFDLDKARKVCSVVVSLFFEHFRKICGRINGVDPYPKLFSVVQKEPFLDSWDGSKWGDSIIEDFESKKPPCVYVEMRTPSHYCNSEKYFGSEFIEVYSSF